MKKNKSSISKVQSYNEFFHVEIDVPEGEIDELLIDEVSQWIE